MSTAIIPNEAKEGVLITVTRERVDDLVRRCMSVVVSGLEDKDGMANARKLRLECVKARTTCEKEHKIAKEEALRECQRIDKSRRDLLALLEPAEKHVRHLEETIEREQERLRKVAEDQLYSARLRKLTDVGGVAPETMLRTMTEPDFAELLARATEEAAAKRERDRIAAEEAERLRLERERLAAERAEMERQRREQEAEAARIRKEAEAKLADERAELERQRRAQEEEAAKVRRQEEARQATERAELQKQQQAIEEERRRLEQERIRREAEERAKRDAEEKLRRDQEEAARREREAALAKRREEAMRPDREKLLSVSAAIRSIVVPEVSAEAAALAASVERILHGAASEIECIARA